MTAAPYVLARTMEEAHAYARKDLGIEIGSYRVVSSPSTLSAVRGVDLHLVPGWETRYDRFAMKGALRWTRMNIVDHSEDDERGPLTDRIQEVAHRYNRLRDDKPVAIICQAVPDDTEPPKSHTDLVARVLPVADSNGDNMVSEGGPALAEDVAKGEPKPVKRRRSRCKECGTLHFKEDPCPGDPFPVE